MGEANNLNRDDQFLHDLNTIVHENLDNEAFSVDDLANAYGISRSQLHRKLRKLRKQSISQFIREIRLVEALKLLEGNYGNVSEVAYKVGFGSPTYFNTCFRNYFGFPPGEAKLRSERDQNEELKSGQGQSHGTLTVNSKMSRSSTLSGLILLLIAVIFGFAFYLSESSTKANNDSDSTMMAGPEIPAKSIAVLPFEDMSVDKDQAPFTDAMVVEINNRLVKIEDLLVTSRSSTLGYRGVAKSSKEIAAELKVATLLTGNVQREGDRIRVTAQLVDGLTDHFLWSETYEAEISDVFAIQSEIAHEVAEQLKIQVSPELDRRINHRPTDNIEAYDLYLEAKGLKKGPEHSLQLLEKAIRLDPEFADAYIEMALTKLIVVGQSNFNKDEVDEVVDEIFELLRTAIEIDPYNAEAYHFMASTYVSHLFDFEKADYYYNKGLELNPSASWNMYPFLFLLPTGRFKEALNYNSYSVLPSQPNNAGVWMIQALCHYYLGNSAKIDDSLDNAFEINGDYVSKHHGYFMISCYQGKYELIAKNYEGFSATDNVLPRHLGMVGIAYHNLGRNNKVSEILNLLEKAHNKTKVGSPAYFMASIHAEMDNSELAIKWLNESYRNREMDLIWLKVDPLWNSIRQQKGFQQIISQMNFID